MKNFEDAKQEYRKFLDSLNDVASNDVINDGASKESQDLSNSKDDFIYADVIKSDLSVFKGKIR